MIIELDGKRRQVELRRNGEEWVAAVDGREFLVDAAEIGGTWSLLIGPVEAGHHERRISYEVAIESATSGADSGSGRTSQIVVHVNGTPVVLSVADRRGAFERRRHHGAAAPGGQTVVAPMSGRIVKVLVTPGEPVESRQSLIVVEAMKMENELRAPRAGIVARVLVAEGASVEANAVLVVLE